MSSTANVIETSQLRALLPSYRWAALIALLVVETVALTVLFDGYAVTKELGWSSVWLSLSSTLTKAGIAAAVATILFGGARLRIVWQHHVDSNRDEESSDRRWSYWYPLLAHFAALALFTKITVFITEGNIHDSAHPDVWAVAWFGTGLVP